MRSDASRSQNLEYMRKRRLCPEFKEHERQRMADRRKDPVFHADEQAQKRKTNAKRRQLFDSLKMERGCYDCGGMLPAEALDWDHLPGVEKCFNIGPEVNSHPLQEVILEINKCQVVCATCHRIRTANRKQEREVVILSES